MLLNPGYSEKAIEYYLNSPNQEPLDDAGQVIETTGPYPREISIILKELFHASI